MKIWDIQKFNREIEALKKLKADKEAMHPLLKAQIRQRVMLSLDERAGHAVGTPFKIRFLRYAAGLLAALSLSAGTVFAATGSLPGDVLYPVKQIKEQVELKIAATPTAKAKVKAKHAQERIRELGIIKKEDKDEESLKSENHESIQSSSSSNASVFENIQSSVASSVSPNPNAPLRVYKKKARLNAEEHAKTEIKDALKELQETTADLKKQGKNQEAESVDSKITELKKNARALDLLEEDLELKKDRLEKDKKEEQSDSIRDRDKENNGKNPLNPKR